MGYGPRITDYGLLIDNKQTDFFFINWGQQYATDCYVIENSGCLYL